MKNIDRKELLELMKFLNRDRGITVILVTHFTEEVRNADYLYLMKEGKIAGQGTTELLADQADLVEDCGVLFSGDAVTPIMCLFFEDSLSIQEWRDKTLARMADLPFEHFYTGHHDHAFVKDDLPSFDAAGAYALADRGMEWQHNRLHEFRGIIHLCPSETFDADSVDFRAVIDRWHELPPRKRRRSH